MKFLSSLAKKDLVNKTCLLRVDFNILESELNKYQRGFNRLPLRIEAALPTIKFLIKKGVRVIILSHRSRLPAVKIKQVNPRKEFSLKPFVKILSKLLKKPVHFIDFDFETSNIPESTSILRKTAVLSIKNSPPGSIFLLENLRFLPGEDNNDKRLAKQLSSLADFYVNDAFSVSHRKNASVVAITKFLPSYAGLLLEKEIKNLSGAMKNPSRPLVIILGGAKISDKVGLIKNFLKKANYFLIGGAIANTFLAAKKIPVGDSLYEKTMIPLAQKLLRFKKIILPIDFRTEKGKILDIGLKTIEKYKEIIKKARTIIWNGPLGYLENPKFAKGSEAIIQAILKSRAFLIVGGGETSSLFQNLKFKIRNPKFFLSTGGGAMLEYLAGKKLPGLKALK